MERKIWENRPSTATKLNAEALNDLEERVENAITVIELTPGPKGDKGDTGEQGIQGEQGLAGSDGIDGENGSLVLGQSAVAITHTAIAGVNQALASVLIPGGLMGPNGRLRIHCHWTASGAASNRSYWIAFAGGIYGLRTDQLTGYRLTMDIVNRNSENSQFGSGQGLVSSGGAILFSQAASGDTSVDQTLAFGSNRANGTDTIILQSHCVELIQ